MSDVCVLTHSKLDLKNNTQPQGTKEKDMISALEVDAITRKARSDESDILVIEMLDIIERRIIQAANDGEESVVIKLSRKYVRNDDVEYALMVICSRLEAEGFGVEFGYILDDWRPRFQIYWFFESSESFNESRIHELGTPENPATQQDVQDKSDELKARSNV